MEREIGDQKTDAPNSGTLRVAKSPVLRYGCPTMSQCIPAFLGQPLLLFGSSASLHGTSTGRSLSKRIRPRFVASVARESDPITSSPLGAPSVVCFGEALFDLFAESPSASVTDASTWTAKPGGAPANLAAGLAKLSTASAIVGSVGDDTEGVDLQKLLADSGVNVDGLQQVPGRSTRRVFVRRNESGDPTFVGFSGENDQFADAVGLDLDALPGVLFYAAQIMVAPTLSLAFPGSAAVLRELVEVAKMCKLRIFVDINWRDVFWEGQASAAEARDTILAFLRDAPGVDFVKLSQEEVAFLFNDALASSALEEPDAVLHKLGGQCCGVIVTAGSDGAAYAFEGGMEAVVGKIPAVMPEGGVVDTTGAGDAFLAGFLSEMLRMGGPFALTDKHKARRIAEFAATVASFVVAGPGAMDPLPSREQVEALLAKRVA